MIARNPEIVNAYLDKHPYIIEFLEAIRPITTKFFGRSVNVELEVLTYLDESGTEELVGWVQTDMGGSYAPRSLEQGAETVAWLATLPEDGPTSGFFRDKRPYDW